MLDPLEIPLILCDYSKLRSRGRAGNKHRAWKIWQKFEAFVMKILKRKENKLHTFYNKFNKCM